MKLFLLLSILAFFPGAAGIAGPGEEKNENPIPEIPKDQLPPRTARPPDPSREQYLREKVFIRIEESVQPRDKPAYTPEFPLLQFHLSQYFRRAGYQVVEKAEDAQFVLRGSFKARYVKAITFQRQDIAHQYSGDVELRVYGKGGEELEKIEIKDFLKEGILGVDEKRENRQEAHVIQDIRRHLAKIVWNRLYHVGKVFTDRKIPQLLASLAADDLLMEAPVQGDDVIKALVARHFEAVPYLLEALSDERMVRVNAHYPGLTAQNATSLKIYHIADKALEEIFQKVSRMNLRTTARLRFLIIRGWENEWKRFCPSFRESPKIPGNQ